VVTLGCFVWGRQDLQLDLKSTVQLGIELTSRLEEIHADGYVLNDFSLKNILIGRIPRQQGPQIDFKSHNSRVIAGRLFTESG